MKHQHTADVNVELDIRAQEIGDLVDKITDSVVTIIAAVTVAQIIRKVIA